MIKHPLIWTVSLIGSVISTIISTIFITLVFVAILLSNVMNEIIISIEATDTRSRRIYRKMFRRRNE